MSATLSGEPIDDFVIDNFDLAKQRLSNLSGDAHADSFAIVSELERRALRC